MCASGSDGARPTCGGGTASFGLSALGPKMFILGGGEPGGSFGELCMVVWKCGVGCTVGTWMDGSDGWGHCLAKIEEGLLEN